MSTAVQNTGAAGALAALQNLGAAIAKTQQSAPRGASDPFLKMDTHGTWRYGSENIEVEAGSEWAFNPLSAQHGWVCWKAKPQGSKEKSEKLGEQTFPLGADLPLKATLPDMGLNGTFKNNWAYFVSIGAKCITEGEDEGEQVIYNPSSMGGVDALLGRDRNSGLLGAIRDQIAKDPTHPVPVCLLQNSSYHNETYGNRTFVPVLEIVEWIGMDGVAADPEPAPEAAAPEPEPEPEQTAQPEPEQPPQTAARRRRGSTAPAAQEPANAPVETVQAAPAPASSDGAVRRRRRA